MIKFSKYIWLYIIISTIVLVPGIYSIARWGLRPAVDFTGGTLLELSFENEFPHEDLEGIAKNLELPVVSIQKSQERGFVLRFKPIEDNAVNNFITALKDGSHEAVGVVRNETVGPTLGKELFTKTITATVFAVLMILVYIAYAFKNIKFGTCAILALIHDFLVVVGIFSLLGKFYSVEVDTLFVTALLTTMSFSVHDTIVVFDRIRERMKGKGRREFEDVVNIALTETMSRSLINSFTIIFMLFALVLMGGETVRFFIVALLIGTVTGTYSSPFVATQFLILWDRFEQKK